jgi:hypothetical protein
MTRLVLAALVLLNCASFTTKLFAQASQTAPPVPLTAPSLNTTTLTCQINCDTQAMNCQNSCIPTAAPTPGGASGQRRLQSQLFDTAACLQTAVLNGHCRSRDWLKFKNPAAPAVKREAEEEWGRKRWR